MSVVRHHSLATTVLRSCQGFFTNLSVVLISGAFVRVVMSVISARLIFTVAMMWFARMVTVCTESKQCI